jgi:tetratricopeptide (TPR) repeat protein
MHARPFVLGLALGALLVAVPAWMTRGAEASGPGLPGLGPRADGSSGDADASAEATAEIARLRALIADLQAASGRQPVAGTEDAAGPAAGAEARTAAAQPLAPDRRTDGLLAEIDEMLRTGILRERCAGPDGALVYFLLDTWIETGHPERALELLTRFDLIAEAGGYGSYLGGLLAARGDRDLAIQAYTVGLRSDPSDWDSILQLAKLDPAAALRIRAELGGEPREDGDFRSQRALLLLADGPRDAAPAALGALLEAGSLAEPVWAELVEREPALAEKFLRTRMSAVSEDERSQVWMQLVAALRNQGRSEDARTELGAMRELWPEAPDVLAALADLDPGGALAFLQRQTAQSPSPTGWALYAERLLAAGRTEEAIAAYYQAHELGPQQGYQGQLLELDPARFAPRLTEQAQASGDDELFGDIGDAYWRSGDHGRALDHWRRALALDPGDGEWVGKVRAVEQGRDPLN